MNNLTVSSLSSNFPVFPTVARENLATRQFVQRDAQQDDRGEELRVDDIEGNSATGFRLHQVTQLFRDVGDTDADSAPNVNFDGLPHDRRNALQTYLDTAQASINNTQNAELVVGVDTFV